MEKLKVEHIQLHWRVFSTCYINFENGHNNKRYTLEMNRVDNEWVPYKIYHDGKGHCTLCGENNLFYACEWFESAQLKDMHAYLIIQKEVRLKLLLL